MLEVVIREDKDAQDQKISGKRGKLKKKNRGGGEREIDYHY